MNKPLKTEKKQKKHLFEKGNKFGKGRPKKEHTFSDTARELLKAKALDIDFVVEKDGKRKEKNIHLETTVNFYHGLVVALISEGLKGDTRAIKELIDRSDGKVTEKVETKQEQVIKIVDDDGTDDLEL